MKLITLLSTLFFATSVFASAKMYDLKMQLSLNGKVASTPRMVVKEGQVGEIRQKSDGQQELYIEVLASDGEMLGHKGILMEMKVGYINEDGTRTLKSEPRILAKAGEEALITVKSKGGADMSLKVVANHKNL